MKIYLVGGAVRDELLGLPIKEKDWVVVGGSIKEMKSNNYKQVGKNFPVFLHPETKEEYALARTEKKISSGYTGFVTNTNKEITLEEDLKRRDLTINAIAKDFNNNLIDPYHGIKDLKNRKLRHISDSFIEDPLRILRVARFHAKLAHLGFSVATETKRLMQKPSINKELLTLPSERVWNEFEKGICERSPHIFIKTLYECGALEILLPELDCCFHKEDNMRNVSENIGIRTLNALEYAANKNFNGPIRWAICLHGIDSSTRSKNFSNKIIKLEPVAISKLERLSKRLNVPNKFNKLAFLLTNFCDFILDAGNSKPDLIINLLNHCDAWRNESRFEDLLLCCEAIGSTNTIKENKPLSSIFFLRRVLATCKKIKVNEFIDAGMKDKDIGESLNNARKICIAGVKKQF